MGKQTMPKVYLLAKETKVGDVCKCVHCGTEFVKKQWQQVFCCSHCKDAFWNGRNHGDRHSKGYYSRYNAAHPERLERGYTKGYEDGCVSNGKKPKKILGKIGLDNILGWDEFGFPITDNPIGDLLRHKEAEWHDDDWCESGPFDD